MKEAPFFLSFVAAFVSGVINVAEVHCLPESYNGTGGEEEERHRCTEKGELGQMGGYPRASFFQDDKNHASPYCVFLHVCGLALFKAPCAAV